MQTVNSQTSPEPVNISSGEAVSFDSMEEVEALSQQKEESETEKPAKEPKRVGKDKEKEVDEKQSEKESEKDESVHEKAPPLAKDTKLIKNIKVKHGDKVLDIAPDALIPVKVDGKIEEKPLQEIINGFSGQSSLDRKFHEFKKERETFDSDKRAVQRMIQEAYDLIVAKQDLRGFVDKVAGSFGANPQEVYSQMMGKLKESMESKLALTPEERERAELAEQLEYYKKREQAEYEAKRKTQEAKEIEAKAQSVLKQKGISEEEFVAGFEALAKQGEKPANQITLDEVVSFIEHGKIEAKESQVKESISQMIEEYAPELKDKDVKIAELTKLAKAIDADEETLKFAIQSMWQKQTDKELSRKVNKSLGRSRAENGVIDPQKSPTWFEEL